MPKKTEQDAVQSAKLVKSIVEEFSARLTAIWEATPLRVEVKHTIEQTSRNDLADQRVSTDATLRVLFERYGELLRRAWLNPSCAVWQRDVRDFERTHLGVLKPYFKQWQDAGAHDNRPLEEPNE